MKIAVYGIAQNEAAHVRRWEASAQDADGIFVLHLGSDDDTTRKLREAQSINGNFHVCRGYVRPFRFDTARNAALTLIPPDYDCCISLDFDEVLTTGWRKRIEEVCLPSWAPNNTACIKCRLKHTEEHTFDTTNRIHSRFGWVWRYPAHEGLYDYGSPKYVYKIEGAPLIVHFQNKGKSRDQYLELLRTGVLENPHSKRAVHYFGRELYYRGKYEEALVRLFQYEQMDDGVINPVEAQENAQLLVDCQKKALQRCK